MNAAQATSQFKSQFLVHKQKYLPRPKLLDYAVGQSLLWMNAPAGFGKSVLLSQLSHELEQQNYVVVKYSVDERDENGEEFLLQLMQAVEYQLGITITAHKDWQPADLQQAMLLWLDFLTAHPELVVMFDNVHLLKESDSWSVLLRLLELKSEKQKIYLASRYLPQSLNKLHLKPELAWLNADALCFNDDQTQEFLQQKNIPQAADLVPALNNTLQGWPAGIGIWIANFHAQEYTQTALGDYLQGEVLAALPTPMLGFLRICSVLGRFNEALLQQCYGNDDYHELLQQAVQQNLFVQQIKQRVGWYQIHPVMAAHLAQDLPYGQRQRLHQMAFELLSQHSEYSVTALKHATKAGMTEKIQGWLLQESEQILANLDIASLLHWFELLDDIWLERNPRLLAIYCWALLITQQREAAAAKLNQLKQLGYLQTYEQKAFDGYFARLDCQLKTADELCLQAFKRLPTTHFTLRILMLTTLSQLAISKQDLHGARQFNLQASKIAAQNHAPGLEALSLYYAARVHFYAGRITNALEEIERGLNLLASAGDSNERLPRGRLMLYQVMLQWLTGVENESLNERLQQGLALCAQQRDVAICYGYIVQAIMLSQSDQVQAAFKVLDAAQWLMQRWRVEPKTYQGLQVVRIHLQLNHGQLAAAKQGMEQLLQDTKEQGIAQSELFPLLPGVVRLTQGRLLLLNGQVDVCLAFIEKAQKQKGSVVYRALLELLRALCLRQQNPEQGQQLLSLAVRSLQKESISVDLLHWFASLHQQSHAQIQEIPSNANLSEREIEVLKKISQGYTNQEIADQMFISLNTVKTHARKINIKLAVKNRTQALVRATELGLL